MRWAKAGMHSKQSLKLGYQLLTQGNNLLIVG
jgi:hypothetical protein